LRITEALNQTPVSSIDLSRYVAARGSETVGEVVARMSAAELSCAIVVSDDGTVAGVFTQQDAVRRVVGNTGVRDQPIRDFMTSPVQTISNSASLADGLSVMTEWWVRSVPVVDQNDRLAGNLSYYAVVTTISNLLAARVSGAIGEATMRHALTLIDFSGLNMSVPSIIQTDDSLDAALQRLRAGSLGSILVTDETGHLVGELSEFDVLTKVGCSEADLSTVPVSSVMSRHPVALNARSSIADVMEEILEEEASNIPLVAESGKPVGVASFRDIATFIDAALSTLE
jgi:CBS domain-containing protein